MAMDLKLDQTDRDLLGFLQNNARESAANLARKLGIARTTVVARIERLEREGIVAGYGLRLGRNLEASAIQVYCGLKVLPRTTSTLLKQLSRFNEVQEVCSVSGKFDYMIALQCESTERLDSILDQIGQIEGIQETHTSVVLSKKIDRKSSVDFPGQP